MYRPLKGRVPPLLSESAPDMSMSKDLAETLTALATLVILPELTTSQLGWLEVLVLLFDRRDRRNGEDE